MARISRERIERAFREGQWRAWVSDIRRSWVVTTIIAVLLAATFAVYGAERRSRGFEVGEIAGVHLLETETGSYPYADVRLQSGRTVTILAPRNMALAPGDRIRVEKFEYWWPSRRTEYRYAFPRRNPHEAAGVSAN